MQDFEQKYTRFLLGEASDEEETEIALATLDDDLYEEMELIEDDLVTNYLRGHLTLSEAALFKKNYLGSTPERNNRIILTEAFLAKVERVEKEREEKTERKVATVAGGRWFFRLPVLKYGMPAILGALLGGGVVYFLLSKPVPPGDEAQLRRIQELEADQRNTAALVENLQKQNQELSERLAEFPEQTPQQIANNGKNTNAQQKPQQAIHKPITLDIRASLSNLGSPKDEKPVPLPREVSRVRLHVPIGQLSAGNYKIMLGSFPVKSSTIVTVNDRRYVLFTVPAKRLKAGINSLTLYEIDAAGQQNKLGGYSFEIQKN